jgi:GNAT superfamily N-acetyltransferase
MSLEVPATGIAGVVLRPVADADYPFLRGLFRSTREAELASTGWSEAEKKAFCDSQFTLQDRWYREHNPGAALLAIEKDGVAAGRIYLDATAGELRLMEITLAPEARNQGLGTALVSWLLDWAAREGRGVTLHVEPFNPARKLYARFGFVDDGEAGIYLRMRWQPPAGG